MNKKNIFLTFIITLIVSTFSFAQYDNLTAAVADINSTLTSAGNTSVFTVDEKGEAKKEDQEFGTIYEFNLNSVEMIQHEQQLNKHMVKFLCASGKECFSCADNKGAGVIHFLEVDTQANAEKIIAAFLYLKRETSMF